MVSVKLRRLQGGGKPLTEWTALSGQARDADIEVDARAAGVGAGNDGAGDNIALRKSGDVLRALRIVLDDWSISG